MLEGTKVKLTQSAANVLNDTFSVDALKGGLDIGVAKITVNTKLAWPQGAGRDRTTTQWGSSSLTEGASDWAQSA